MTTTTTGVKLKQGDQLGDGSSTVQNPSDQVRIQQMRDELAERARKVAVEKCISDVKKVDVYPDDTKSVVFDTYAEYDADFTMRMQAVMQADIDRREENAKLVRTNKALNGTRAKAKKTRQVLQNGAKMHGETPTAHAHRRVAVGARRWVFCRHYRRELCVFRLRGLGRRGAAARFSRRQATARSQIVQIRRSS